MREMLTHVYFQGFLSENAPSFDRFLASLNAEPCDNRRKKKIVKRVRDIVNGRGGDVVLVNDVSYDRWTLEGRPSAAVNFLQYAILSGKAAIVELLANVPGIAINVLHYEWRVTPLIMAIQKKSVDLVKVLLDVPEIDVNVRAGHFKRTALHFAVEYRCVPIAALLVQAPGVDVNARDVEDQTPLDLAVVRNTTDMVAFLMKVTALNANCDVGWASLLHLASRLGYHGIVEMLLKVPGINVNAPDCIQQTPLHNAVVKGHRSVIELLLNAPGVDVNARDKHGDTPLHDAVRGRHPSVIELLLNAPGIKICAQNRCKKTARQMASKRGSSAIVKALDDARQARRGRRFRSFVRRVQGVLSCSAMADASNGH